MLAPRLRFRLLRKRIMHEDGGRSFPEGATLLQAFFGMDNPSMASVLRGSDKVRSNAVYRLPALATLIQQLVPEAMKCTRLVALQCR